MFKALTTLALSLSLLAGGATASSFASTSTIPTCATEDSTNCFWDASKQGNGLGQSFVDVDGVAYYVDTNH